MSEDRYPFQALIDFSTTLLTHAGLPEDRARTVASTLVEADLMGHTTHGLHLLAPYVKEVEEGKMKSAGEPVVISDKGSAITWDGSYLPGPWLIHKAMDLAFERVLTHPVVTIAIRRSHHIACLAAYPEYATKRGLMMLLSTADPRTKTVAPFGGLDPVYTPNPIAGGIPTEGAPILFDVSMSLTSNGLVQRTYAEEKKLQYKWLLNNRGEATNDPKAFVEEQPPATVLPIGGMEAGYKGYALGLLVEALTCGLAGYGRADDPDTWGASVFMQVIDPEAFGGKAAFQKQNQTLVDACKASRPIDEDRPVRVPGDRAFQLREEQKRIGVKLYATIVPALKSVGEKYGLEFPKVVVN